MLSAGTNWTRCSIDAFNVNDSNGEARISVAELNNVRKISPWT
jgi:hypothetical protein